MENWKKDGNEFVKEKFFIEDYERLYSDIIIAVLIKMDFVLRIYSIISFKCYFNCNRE